MHGMDSAYGLWSLVILNSANFHYFCFQLCQASNENGLAQFRRVFGLSGGAVY